jgi:hypothetical protein
MLRLAKREIKSSSSSLELPSSLDVVYLGVALECTFFFLSSIAMRHLWPTLGKRMPVGTMLRRRRSCRKKWFSAEAVCMGWPKVPLHGASVLQTDLKIE